MGKPCCLRYLFSMVFVFFLSGCAKELSTTPYISIKQSSHRHVLYSARRRYEGVTIPAVIHNLNYQNNKKRIISEVDLSPTFDILVETDPETVIKGFEDAFCFSITKDKRAIPVYVLTYNAPLTDVIVRSQSDNVSRWEVSPIYRCRHYYHLETYLDFFKPYEPTRYRFTGFALKDFVFWLEKHQRAIFVDETGLTDSYDFELVVDAKNKISIEGSLKAMGFNISIGDRPIDAIYIDVISECTPQMKFKKPPGDYVVYPAREQPK